MLAAPDPPLSRRFHELLGVRAPSLGASVKKMTLAYILTLPGRQSVTGAADAQPVVVYITHGTQFTSFCGRGVAAYDRGLIPCRLLVERNARRITAGAVQAGWLAHYLVYSTG